MPIVCLRRGSCAGACTHACTYARTRTRTRARTQLAHGTQRTGRRQLFDGLAGAAQGKLAGFDARAMCATAWAVGVGRPEAEGAARELLAAMAERVRRRDVELGRAEVIELSWAERGL